MVSYLIGAIIWGIVWGTVTNIVISNKGYQENWFWWGFFFGFIATIVAFSKPEAKKSNSSLSYSNNTYLRNTKIDAHNKLMSGYWECTCGIINPDYTGTCGCGKTKSEVQQKVSASDVIQSKSPSMQRIRLDKQNNLKKGYWKCICGTLNPDYIGTCSCGKTKSETQEKVLNNIKNKNEKELDKFELIKKHKELLDIGAITEDEYNKKKKELLDLNE